jgi:HAD superfamily phosphoserine phosphatase-like hydrolase
MNNKSAKDLLQYFRVKDNQKALRKLNKFIAEGKNKLHFLIDFDRTLTIGIDKTGRDISSWQILGNHLSEKARVKQRKLFLKYRPLEISGTMSHDEALSWAHQTLNIFTKDGINLNEIEKDFQQKTDIRPYAKEMLTFSEKLGIPTVILSAGIKEIISLWAKTFQVSPTLILATNLIIDQNGKIIDWNKNIVHTLNKKEQEHDKLTKIKEERPNTILIGDAFEDAEMTDGDKNVLRIRIFNPREDEKITQEEFADKTFEKYDLMIENGTLEPILKILEMIN